MGIRRYASDPSEVTEWTLPDAVGMGSVVMGSVLVPFALVSLVSLAHWPVPELHHVGYWDLPLRSEYGHMRNRLRQVHSEPSNTE
jgi:hypothetical protein